MTKPRKRAPDWIQDGEKFALIGLDVRCTPDVSQFVASNRLTVLPDADFELPEHWREWLGTIRVEDVSRCSLFLLAKDTSASLSVLDAENHHLCGAVNDLLMGLMLTNKFATSDSPFMATGSCIYGEVDVRQFARINPPMRSIVGSDDEISLAQLQRAAQLAQALDAIRKAPRTSNWRLLRCLSIYQETRCEGNTLDRIHQFTRCIEGLIVPEPGSTKKQFKSRTEQFVGPSHHDLMGKIYDIRSAVEHMQEHQYLEKFDRATRIRLAEYEAVSEWVARSCLERILLNPVLTAHFGAVDSSKAFWERGPDERKQIWGAQFDPKAPLANFIFDNVRDAALGAEE
ncbi:hypothetical protein SAMN05443999_11817 [Roseovarius azorensis]|uniref:Apea-like HEPN domain-containing protein n=1 Tax=Roseovarius azorensis TaxID=1287727 RepID=A0A1H7X154_9RHOB|nr:hypothetical protein [Roseovarius azorensis]SEM27590.1 hypothetical protein SAMN05443999_11817 [Roseovarius azorensis]